MMTSSDLATELIRQLLSEGKQSLKIEVRQDKTTNTFVVEVRNLAQGEVILTKSVLYPAATNVCEKCGK